ncbi:MAG: polyprenyl synthetase family protein [Myxococcaceae bacterium]
MRVHAESSVGSREAPTSLLDLLEAHLGSSECRSLLHGMPESLARRALPDPARDFLSRDGRQFRARLVRIAWELALSGRDDRPPLAPELPLLIELIHAGSLIVDDVQDDARERRGAPALHLTWGTPVAINTGNWLYFLPQLMLQQAGLAPTLELSLHRAISRALVWCHQGQGLDLQARSFELERAQIGNVVSVISRLKTGTLMELAATVGATAAGADEKQTAALVRFGNDLGVGLQMLNDLVGIRAASERRCEDLRSARATWCWAWAAEQFVPPEYERLKAQAQEVAECGTDPRPLAKALACVIEPGVRASRIHLQGALQRLRAELGPSPGMTSLQAEVERLVESHV